MFKIVNFCVGSVIPKPIILNNGGWLASPYIQNRTITSKKFRVKRPKPAPFPYKERRYNWFWGTFDKTYSRFDENSKIIIIEGPVGSGKHELAKVLADELDMKYIPDITTDFDYINDAGYDMRNLNSKLPESVQTFDENDFLRDPFHIGCAAFQSGKYRLRWTRYWQMLEHLLSTGQGIVTVRSPFSTGVFTNAMRQCNYISEPAKYYYNEVVRHTILFLFRPHLVIYLDVPVDKTMENIKKRNRDLEVNGKALTSEFMQYIEDGYKNVYLREASIHSLVLHYNWADGGDNEVVVEDIERIDFEKYLDETVEDLKLIDWRKEEYIIDEDRELFSLEQEEHLQYFNNVMIYDAPEVYAPGKDEELWQKFWFSAPGMKYDPGYNYDQGDSVLFKNRIVKRWTF